MKSPYFSKGKEKVQLRKQPLIMMIKMIFKFQHMKEIKVSIKKSQKILKINYKIKSHRKKINCKLNWIKK